MSLRARRIAELNDQFREIFHTGRVFLTRGIITLPDEVREAVMLKVRTFTGFNTGNDPYGVHDFGAFHVGGVGRVFWKIDYYYTADECYESPDPADPAVTRRVLTIMLASEY